MERHQDRSGQGVTVKLSEHFLRSALRAKVSGRYVAGEHRRCCQGPEFLARDYLRRQYPFVLILPGRSHRSVRKVCDVYFFYVDRRAKKSPSTNPLLPVSF